MTLTVSSYPRHGWRNPTARACLPRWRRVIARGSCCRSGTRLDARNSVESGAILPDRLGAPDRRQRAGVSAQLQIGPSIRLVPGRCGMKRPQAPYSGLGLNAQGRYRIQGRQADRWMEGNDSGARRDALGG